MLDADGRRRTKSSWLGSSVDKVWVAGIDPDTKAITAAFHPLYQGGSVETIRVEAKGRLAENRFPILCSQFRSIASMFKRCQWVYVERPPMGVNPRATIDQAAVMGAILEILHSEGVGFSTVDPGTWKKQVIGNGHADKPLIKAWVIANLGVPDGLHQDAYDAAAIAHFGVSTPLVGEDSEDEVQPAE